MHEQQVSSSEALLTLFKTKAVQSHLPKQTKKAFNKYPKIAADILLTLDKNAESQSSIIELIEQKKKKQNTYIYVVFTMYPVDGYRLAEKLAASDKIDNETITTASLRAGFDPAIISPPTAANNEGYRIVPLMESASITLYNQTENASAEIKFKAQNDTQWQQGLALQWEPIQGALSGSIVYLTPNTQYEVKVSLSENGVLLSEEQYSFTTRAESPPIDPDKIYYLSEIYQGGQLDIEALGIEGNANGWAKIIGDGVIIEPAVKDLSAINIGSQNYVMFENITTKGGEKYGIHGYKAHHIWIKGCNVSNFGRVASDFRKGIGYHSAGSSTPINYDSGIYLERSGVVVIEDCEIHSPNGKANSWEFGHPKGPSALQVWGHHRVEAFRGQHIVRDNRFFGAPNRRFNDVIEGRGNRKRDGGFGRDSAVYNNYLAYANDDIIEIDGGQANVLVYNNEITQGYCGISTAPNMIGPSYVFHNYIHDLGDERGKEWTSIKMGGLISSPAGITNVLENLVVTNRNGISASSVNGDRSFWVNARNNVFVSRQYRNMVGLGIYDLEKYSESTFANNLIYNISAQRPVYDVNEGENFLHPESYNTNLISDILHAGSSINIDVEYENLIPNFSQSSDAMIDNATDMPANGDAPLPPIDLSNLTVTSFDNQDSSKAYEINEDGLQITLSGNTWKSVPYNYTVNPDTIVELDINHNGIGEIIGMAFETDNKLTNSHLFKFFGTQDWQSNGPETTLIDEPETLKLNLGQYVTGPINRLVFALDYDDEHSATVPIATFGNIKIYDSSSEVPTFEANEVPSYPSVERTSISVGISK
tara:strand:+ start:1900 stop:4359 length:2460 start_codon:yes stop_codon:yes gene_type:complete